LKLLFISFFSKIVLFFIAQQKLKFFEKITESQPLQELNINPITSYLSKQKPNTSNSDNNASSSNKTSSTVQTSTPKNSSSGNNINWKWKQNFPAKQVSSKSSLQQQHLLPSTSSALHHADMNSHKFRLFDKDILSNAESSGNLNLNNNFNNKKDCGLKLKDFQDVFNDLHTFVVKELNEIEARKRIGYASMNRLNSMSKNSKENDYEDNLHQTLLKLQNDVHELKENQRQFENKIQRYQSNENHHVYESVYSSKKKSNTLSYDNPLGSTQSQSSSQQTTQFRKPPCPPMPPKQIKAQSIHNREIINNKRIPIETKVQVIKPVPSVLSKSSSCSSINSEANCPRTEKIRQLENEIFKEETLMMKINRVLENAKVYDEKNLDDVINIERHYLVASTRFQLALSELRKLNDNKVNLNLHTPPYNRKGALFIREITLEIRSSYFQKRTSLKNDYLLILLKYEDKVYATKTLRIKNDIRTVRFLEKFSIPEAYVDFDMRLEVYGTTFWRKSGSVRETMLKKYGFVTFTLADTGNKAKRFSLIEVMQSENVPIRDKIMMKVSQKITTDVKYKGNLYLKSKDIWHESVGVLNGHLLEITFKRPLKSGISQLDEKMLLDLYNIDNESVITVDSRRVSDRPYTFLLKFNHYVDVTSF
jgi:hypothetical protein